MTAKKSAVRRRSVDTKCPYYLFDDSVQKIVCEGVQEGATLHMVFSSWHDFEDYQQARCNTCYEKCPLYRMNDSMRGSYGK